MADTTFIPGTVIVSTWLNDINNNIYKQTSGLVGGTNRSLANALGDFPSVKTFGAVSDGSTNDTAALGLLQTIAKPFVIPSKTAYAYGSVGPSLGMFNRVDYATIGTNEKLTNGTFTGSSTGWTLSNFTYSANTITHVTGTVATASQTITVSPYKTYLVKITLTTTTAGKLGLYFNGSLVTDSDAGQYSIPVGGPITLEFSWLTQASDTGALSYSVQTDNIWAGSIDSLSVLEVQDEMPLDHLFISTDDPALKIPHGIKVGRFNAGVYGFGDRQTLAMTEVAGVWNIGIGPRVLSTNRIGIENTAMGAFAGKYTQSSRNCLFGYGAGKMNTLGEALTYLGYKAGGSGTTGTFNHAIGFHSLLQNTIGNQNHAEGYQSLYNIVDTSFNYGAGVNAGLNSRGTSNTFIGVLAGQLNVNSNTTYTYSGGLSVGSESKVYGENGTALGYLAQIGVDGSPVDNSIALGKGAVTLLANTAKIGNGLNLINLGGRPFYKNIIGSDTTATGISYSTTQFVERIVLQRSSTSGDFSDTTPSAAAIVAAIPGCEVNTGYLFYIKNASSHTLTLVAGTGVTLSGTTTIATGQTRTYAVEVTSITPSAEAVFVFGLETAAN